MLMWCFLEFTALLDIWTCIIIIALSIAFSFSFTCYYMVFTPSLPKNAAVLFTVDESYSLVLVAVFIGLQRSPTHILNSCRLEEWVLSWCLISRGTFIIGYEVCLSSAIGGCPVKVAEYRACAHNLIPLAVSRMFSSYPWTKLAQRPAAN